MTSVKQVDTIPEYIDTFIRNNMLKLNEIINNGLNENNNNGFLFIKCIKCEDKMDVSFINKENTELIMSLDTWKDIREQYTGNIIIIDDFDYKRIFIVNI